MLSLTIFCIIYLDLVDTSKLFTVAISLYYWRQSLRFSLYVERLLYFIVFCCLTLSLRVSKKWLNRFQMPCQIGNAIFILVVCKWFHCLSHIHYHSILFNFCSFSNNMKKMSVIKLLVSKYLTNIFNCMSIYVSLIRYLILHFEIVFVWWITNFPSFVASEKFILYFFCWWITIVFFL